MDRYQILKKIGFFDYFTRGDLEKFLKESDIEISEYSKNELIISQGSELNQAIFILKGTLKGQKLKENGNLIEIERFSHGTLIAPVFIYAEKNRIPVDLVSVGASSVIAIDREKFFNLLMSSSEAMREFLKISSEKTFAISEKMVEQTSTIRERLERYIDEHRVGDEVRFDVSLKEIAEKFSVERPSLSRVISELLKEGYLEKLGKNYYKILN